MRREDSCYNICSVLEDLIMYEDEMFEEELYRPKRKKRNWFGKFLVLIQAAATAVLMLLVLGTTLRTSG